MYLYYMLPVQSNPWRLSVCGRYGYRLLSHLNNKKALHILLYILDPTSVSGVFEEVTGMDIYDNESISVMELL